MSDMTPVEAAEWVEQSALIHITAKATAVRVLIDHARGTAAPGDLAALATGLDELAEHTEGEGYVEDGRWLRARADQLRAHRCVPAVDVATCACGHVKGEHIGYGDGGCSFLDGLGIAACACMSFAPAAPPAESGDPTGAIARMRDRIGAAVDSVWSPGDNDEDGERDRLLDAVMAVVGDLMRRHARTAVQDMRAARRRLDAARNELAALRGAWGASGGDPS